MCEPQPKKSKLENETGVIKFAPHCKHYVTRKKRFCKIPIKPGHEFCVEHLVSEIPEIDKSPNRIPCPLDPKHTVYANKLTKHLKNCNARPKELPTFINIGINNGSDDDEESDSEADLPLSQVNELLVQEVIEIIEKIYSTFVKGNIKELLTNHEILSEELKNLEYGPTTLKHLNQTSSILGALKHMNFLKEDTSFIEFGAGKGQVSYWLAQVNKNINNVSIILIDRESHRHKQDNKITEKDNVCRIRADIADLNLKKIDVLKEQPKRYIGVSKHLCGAGTDLALRCIVNGNKKENDETVIPTEGLFIALCCHHRCEYKHFVGKKFFKDNGINKKLFKLITKMGGWAICGDGLSREKRKTLAENPKEQQTKDDLDTTTTYQSKLTMAEKLEIGLKSKRIIDYARSKYLQDNGFECDLNMFVPQNVTAENICLIAKLK